MLIWRWYTNTKPYPFGHVHDALANAVSAVGGEVLDLYEETRDLSNYWCFGVREIPKRTYDKILAQATTKGYARSLPSEHNELESFDVTEGKKKVRFSAYYERNPFYRAKAIEVHGLSCMAFGCNFEENFGPLGKGFIHIHHNKPISESGPTTINPQTDLSVLCPNCHTMVHRNKNHTLSLRELKRYSARAEVSVDCHWNRLLN